MGKKNEMSIEQTADLIVNFTRAEKRFQRWCISTHFLWQQCQCWPWSERQVFSSDQGVVIILCLDGGAILEIKSNPYEFWRWWRGRWTRCRASWRPPWGKCLYLERKGRFFCLRRFLQEDDQKQHALYALHVILLSNNTVLGQTTSKCLLNFFLVLICLYTNINLSTPALFRG